MFHVRRQRRIALAEQPSTTVTLSYRSAAFSRVKQKYRLALDQAERAGSVRVELESTVHSIEADHVKLQTDLPAPPTTG